MKYAKLKSTLSLLHVGLWAIVVLAVQSCSERPKASPIKIYHAQNDDVGVEALVNDLGTDLGRLLGRSFEERPFAKTTCIPGEIQIQLYQDRLPLEDLQTIKDWQTYSIDEDRCGEGRLVHLWGKSSASLQWAGYDFLESIGIRYFHPEETYYPLEAQWPEEPISKLASPSFRKRSFNVHRTHPIELSAPLDDSDVDMFSHQKNWVDWLVKTRTTLVSGFDPEYLGTYPFDRGLTWSTGLNLANSQQGSKPTINPNDPRSEEEQIAEAIDEKMKPIAGRPAPISFGVSFNASEFTEVDDEVTVDRLTFVANYLGENYPDVIPQATNHGTAQEPTPNFGVRFFNLSQFAPDNLSVSVHPLMFYDMGRAAPVYGNQSFDYLGQWAREMAETRLIQHFPESSWWLTFDLPVPLFLAPVSIEARQYDMDYYKDLLVPDDDATFGVYSHHTFSSGQEWGYWMLDWCVQRMSFDIRYTHNHCLEDYLGIFEGYDEILSIWKDIEARQIDDMRDPELIRFLVGSDDETETAFDAGVELHPLPPGPRITLGYDAEEVAALEGTLQKLEEMAEAYHAHAARLDVLLERQTERAAPWLREIRDGVLVFGLRAAHSLAVYRTSLALREALNASDLSKVDAAYEGVLNTRRITEAAREVIRSREASYRYPEALTIVGGEPGTEGAIPNKTIYPYRYLSRTHRLFYWERPNQQLAALFGEGLEIVQVPRRMIEVGEDLEISILDGLLESVLWDTGDNQVQDNLEAHSYNTAGVYDWVLDATTSAGLVHHEDQLAVVETRLLFKKGSFAVETPPEASIINGVLPGFVVGLGAVDGVDKMILGRIDNGGDVLTRGSLVIRDRMGNSSGPRDLSLDLGEAVGIIDIVDAVIDVDLGAESVSIRGKLAPQQIADRLVGVGGFEPDGAIQLVAAVLQYTPETVPQLVDFVVTASVAE